MTPAIIGDRTFKDDSIVSVERELGRVTSIFLALLIIRYFSGPRVFVDRRIEMDASHVLGSRDRIVKFDKDRSFTVDLGKCLVNH